MARCFVGKSSLPPSGKRDGRTKKQGDERGGVGIWTGCKKGKDGCDIRIKDMWLRLFTAPQIISNIFIKVLPLKFNKTEDLIFCYSLNFYYKKQF